VKFVIWKFIGLKNSPTPKEIFFFLNLMSSSFLSSTVYSKHCHPRLKWHLRFRFPALLCCFRLAASSKDLHRKWPKTRPGPDELHPLDRTRGLRRTRFVGPRHATLGLSVLLPGSRIGFINPTRSNFHLPRSLPVLLHLSLQAILAGLTGLRGTTRTSRSLKCWPIYPGLGVARSVEGVTLVYTWSRW